MVRLIRGCLRGVQKGSSAHAGPSGTFGWNVFGADGVDDESLIRNRAYSRALHECVMFV